MAIAIDATDGLTLEYRRGARRLRGVYGAQPARLQRSLRDLARRHDLRRLIAKTSQRPIVRGIEVRICNPPRASELPPTLTELEHRFAAVVMGQFEGPVLCFSRRKALLDLAARLGIGKFHANFIIASLQHRLNPSDNGTAPEFRVLREKTGLSKSTLVCALVVQSIIAVGLWMVLK